MNYAAILQAVLTALPAVVGGTTQIIHIFQDTDSNTTTVTILERGKAQAQSTTELLKAWNQSHPDPAAVQPVQVSSAPPALPQA